MIKTLYISHQLYDWNKQKNQLDAKFLDRSTMLSILKNDISGGNFYTSLEDLRLGIHEIDQLVDKCQKIIVVDITENLFEELNAEVVPLYLKFLNVLSRHPDKCDSIVKYNSIIIKNVKEKYQERTTDSPTLWVGGCSISAGLYVDSEKKYAEILAHKLDLPLVLLAQGGSSIGWQADQLLRADLRPGDTVVWGLTNITRVNYVNDSGKWKNAPVRRYLDLPKHLRYWSIEYFDSPTQAFPYLKNILQVENFCNKLGIDCYFVNLIYFFTY